MSDDFAGKIAPTILFSQNDMAGNEGGGRKPWTGVSFSHVGMSVLGIPTENGLNSAGFLFAFHLLLSHLEMRGFLVGRPFGVPSLLPV